MTAVHIRNVPDDVLSALKRRAAGNHRSLQKELLHILEAAARGAPPLAPLEPLQLVVVETHHSGTWSREEIYGDDGR